jgi:glyoxylase-like metal-dependent hydrolase (beta-lactamase superfamily II)
MLMPEEIVPNLFRIEIPLPGSPLKYLNSYVVSSDDRNLVIDTGLNRKECAEAMLAGLRELNLDLGRTDFFITHMHADHFGLVSKLATESSRVFFNRPEMEIIEARGGWEPMVSYARMNGFPEDELRAALRNHPGYRYSPDWVPELSLLEDGDILEVGDYAFRCVETPGHTMGHICLYEARRELLVAGDHILIDITPNIQCWSPKGDPLKDYLASLDKVHGLEVRLVLPGHRRILHDHRARIEELKRHHERRAAEVLSILDGRPSTAYEVASHMTWDIAFDSWDRFPPAQKWFATGEAIAHLRYLEEMGELYRVEDHRGVALFGRR